jgi:hypothetical protein
MSSEGPENGEQEAGVSAVTRDCDPSTCCDACYVLGCWFERSDGSRFVSRAQRSMSGQFHAGRPETVHEGGGSTPRCFHVLTVCSATPRRSAMSLDPTGSQFLGGMAAASHVYRGLTSSEYRGYTYDMTKSTTAPKFPNVIAPLPFEARLFNVDTVQGGAPTERLNTESITEALESARSRVGLNIHQASVTALGDDFETFALRHFVWVNGTVADTGWRCWIDGEFVGAGVEA